MNATRILWGQVLTVCSIALAFIWAATQWTAAQLGYQAQLETDTEAVKARVLRGRFGSLARQVALDPDDGMAL